MNTFWFMDFTKGDVILTTTHSRQVYAIYFTCLGSSILHFIHMQILKRLTLPFNIATVAIYLTSMVGPTGRSKGQCALCWETQWYRSRFILAQNVANEKKQLSPNAPRCRTLTVVPLIFCIPIGKRKKGTVASLSPRPFFLIVKRAWPEATLSCYFLPHRYSPISTQQ